MMASILLAIYVLIHMAILFIAWNYLNSSEENIKQPVNNAKHNNFEGKKVVFDGHLDKDREFRIKNELKTSNAIIENKMTEDTDLLVTGKNPDWLVVDEAKTIGVTIVNEMDWQNLNKAKQQIKLKRNIVLIPKKKQADSAEII
ncbi:hypothetical protein [Zunongwangia sp. HRR-M8]|uniref:hypothetical protein n=1 Tax=Zunongwangia sp. HRR-M8 TaxID=3015170 RepID=UPI0022DE28FE|nr:hypothetical protein [Zunongwangia sp. HRR-M8]WBL20884.1 hypothetical protein PBT89_09090 [Zunongwangia sp. HRR-M8]